MGTKDRLIEVLDEESIDAERANFLAIAMLRDLRCENCRHWEHGWHTRDYGTCHQSLDLVTRDITPDFFCALFEDK